MAQTDVYIAFLTPRFRRLPLSGAAVPDVDEYKANEHTESRGRRRRMLYCGGSSKTKRNTLRRLIRNEHQRKQTWSAASQTTTAQRLSVTDTEQARRQKD